MRNRPGCRHPGAEGWATAPVCLALYGQGGKRFSTELQNMGWPFSGTTMILPWGHGPSSELATNGYRQAHPSGKRNERSGVWTGAGKPPVIAKGQVALRSGRSLPQLPANPYARGGERDSTGQAKRDRVRWRARLVVLWNGSRFAVGACGLAA